MAKDGRDLSTKTTDAAVNAFLRDVALTPKIKPAGAKGRLIFALDATASREPTWDQACHIQAQMFAETKTLGGLEIQLVFYRGFGECKSSAWISDSDELVKRMTKVSCLGGQTQISKVLSHAIRETGKRKVDALVFVGDCMEEDVDALCAKAGELGMLGVPAFIFQEGNEPNAMRGFQHMAKLTKGAYCSFDPSSPKQLRDLLSAVAVYAAGGRKALENYGASGSAEVLRIAHQLK